MITSFTGPMFSGKSTGLFNQYQNIWNKKNIIAFKPKIATRDEGVIKSRNIDLEIPAICINNVSEIKEHIKRNTKTIFIDEAQFLEGDVTEILNLSIYEDIDFYIAGLNTTGDQKPFGLMPNILSISDKIYIYDAVCYDCNKKATLTYYELGSLNGHVIGNEGYVPLCNRCLAKRKRRE